jgi:hypothetical protein
MPEPTKLWSRSGLGRREDLLAQGFRSICLRIPLRKVTPFALAGVGTLVFDQKDFVGPTRRRAEFIHGTGADFSLSHRISVQAEYRGMVYNSPTYDLRVFGGLDRVTHRAEPSIGFG